MLYLEAVCAMRIASTAVSLGCRYQLVNTPGCNATVLCKAICSFCPAVYLVLWLRVCVCCSSLGFSPGHLQKNFCGEQGQALHADAELILSCKVRGPTLTGTSWALQDRLYARKCGLESEDHKQNCFLWL